MHRSLKILLAVSLTVSVAVGLVGLVVVNRSLLPYIAERFGQLPLAGDNLQLPAAPNGFDTLWISDFKGNRVLGFNRLGETIWEQYMSNNTAVEYVTVAPNGDLVVADGEGMTVQEIDRKTRNVVWQYGVKDVQGASEGLLHQPDKAFKINDYEVLINDGNNRRVIIVDQRTDKIVWQYGETLKMGSSPGLLRGNTSVVPRPGGKQFLITDTLEKKILIVDRATKEIVWEWVKPDAKWLQHAWPTPEGTFVLEDRQKNEVFEVSGNGDILWTLTALADGSQLQYPTDIIKLGRGSVLIAEAGRGRVIEVVPDTGQVLNTYDGVGFVTTIAIETSLDTAEVKPIVSPTILFVGPRENIPADSPEAYGFWSFAMPVTGVLSRSGQPLISEFEWLQKKGWKGVVNLRVDGEREEVSDDEKLPGFNELGFNYLHLPIVDGHPPTEQQAEQFLAFVTNEANQPVHIHCRGGIGRAGTMIALYRYAVQGWPLEQAIKESRLFKGGISGLQEAWLKGWASRHEPGSYGS